MSLVLACFPLPPGFLAFSPSVFTAFALYSAFERARDLSGFWAFVFSGVSFAVCFGFAFLSPSKCLGACFPGLKLNSRSCGLLPSRAQLNPRPYAHEPPCARCMPFLGSGLPLIPVFGFVLEVFNSGFESRPPANSNSPLNSKLAPA